MTSLPHGIWAASLTPLNADLQCDSEALAQHAFDLISRGCKGIVLFGTTGEGPSFSTAERIETLEKLAALNFPPEKIILANGSASVLDTVELCRAALKIGCPALLIAPPAFYKNVSEEGVVSYYRQIIRTVSSSRLKILLYHIPQNTGIPITIPIIKTLFSEFPETIIGIKESEGNLAFAKQLIESFPSLQVFVAKEPLIPEAARFGASGAICGMANLFPERICDLFEKQESGEIGPMKEAFQGVSFISAAKALLEEKWGESWSRVRPPLLPLDPEQKRRLIPLIKNNF